MALFDWKSDSAELVVLSLLADGPMYGYGISKEVALRSDGQLRLTPGVLYPLLKGLETEGLIVSEWEAVKSDRAAEDGEGRRRKWYKLSAKGRKRLEQRVNAHRSFRRIIDTFIGDADREASR